MRAARYIAALGSAGLALLAAGFVLARRPTITWSARRCSRLSISPRIASGQVQQIPYHLNRAMDNGLTQDQAAEVITHLAFAPAPSTTSSVGLECDGC
jgi:alkylhydroperoxidase/carboxymuconolactone decarboxylase family protein YurZ